MQGRSYFYRAWVFQECAVAGQINVWCGTAVLDAEKLKRFVVAFFRDGWASRSDLFGRIGSFSSFIPIFALSMQIGMLPSQCFPSILKITWISCRPPLVWLLELPP